MTPRIFNRRPSFDERSRAFNIAELLPEAKPRSYTWACTANLDQGQEGACVGFGWAHEANAKPKVRYADDRTARAIYNAAKKVDEWPGENYEGTSVIAGAKVCAGEFGFMREYRWAFNTQDALTALSHFGPVVIGVNWYTGMFEPDASGRLRVTGSVAGGHCILVRGVNVAAKTVLLHNSWGAGWGGTKWGPGTATLSWDDLDRLLHEDGEVCIPVKRL